MSVLNPRSAPGAFLCVGRCSHNVGDAICRGCGRTVDEVREWGRFSDAEKLAVKARAAARLAGGQDAD